MKFRQKKKIEKQTKIPAAVKIPITGVRVGILN